jgi:hypothetical protein
MSGLALKILVKVKQIAVIQETLYMKYATQLRWANQ